MCRLQHHARERLSAEQAMALLGEADTHTSKILARVKRLTPLPDGARILDIGAGQGLFVMCCARRGYDAAGVEPSERARATAAEVLGRSDVARITGGRAENLPFANAEFDFVHANSVIEHVDDPAAAFAEAFRVLKPGGLFWFSTASGLCPRQNEIAGFPLFGWYPDAIKRRIMAWAKRRRPALIGHTEHPAVNWFTPARAKRMLRQAGFDRVLDRWDFRLESEGGRLYRLALRAVRGSRAVRLTADMCVEGCNFAAIKDVARASRP